MRAVHQLLPVLSTGDAIGESTLKLCRRLRAMGYRSEIFASLADRRMQPASRPADELFDALGEGDAVVYHLSIGSPLARVLDGLPSVRAIYYHNISPAAAMERFSPVVAHHLRWGRRDLAALAPIADVCVAESTYNLEELRQAGARRTALVPLDLDLDRLRPRRSVPATPPRLVFIGRLAPHKRQDHLIRVLAALRRVHSPDARLVLAGGAAIPAYVAALRRLASALGVSDAVDILDRPQSAEAIGDIYASASALLCASEHEGFCVPLVEAMAFAVPILAFDGGAVAETVGGAGLVVRHHDPLVWAELAWRLIQDRRLRDTIESGARERLAQLTGLDPGRRLVEALSPSAGAADSATARSC